MQNSAVQYFEKEWRQLKFERNINDLFPSRKEPIVSLKNKTETSIEMNIVFNEPWAFESYFSRYLPMDCIYLIKEYSEEIELKICILLDLHTPLQNIYAYPFHPLIWKLIRMEQNERHNKKYPYYNYFLQSKILFHNRNQDRKNRRTLLQDIESIFSFFFVE